MPTVKGNLLFVSSRAAQVSEVWLRAREVRTHLEGVVTTGNDRFPVDGGEVSFTAVSGPAVLALISQGRAVDTIPILVGDASTQTLRQVVSAAKIADDATQREIEKLAAQAVQLVDSSVANAKKAQDGATRAETAAGNAKQSETNAEDAARRASNSSWSANQIAGFLSQAEQRTEKSASAAAASASQAAGSATSAKQDADRAANIANSTSWSGDKLTVNGKTSPSLTGPKGDRGTSGASTWDAVTGKPTSFPPSSHTHKMADISDLPEVGFSEGKIAKYASGGVLIVRDNGSQNTATSRLYVDRAVGEKADKSYVDTALSSKAAQVDVLALQQKLARLTAPVTVFQGSHDLSKGKIVIVTPRMYGTVTINISQATPGTNGGLVQPCIFNYLGTRYKGSMDGWWTTTSGAGTAYKYLTDTENGQKITLDPGYYIEGIEIHPWDTGATTITKITVQN
ncbi:hypothetical protein ACLI1L_000816 [Corynebacterium sp. LaCa117]|uniref:hypothetical protein n=1 Tax=Corynebacterium sp. LaCa117 TaxID=3391424 RepID=UPI003989C645